MSKHKKSHIHAPSRPEQFEPTPARRGSISPTVLMLGVHNAANSLGQASGPLLGSALFIWQMNAPYLLTGAVLLAVALLIGWQAMGRQREARLA